MVLKFNDMPYETWNLEGDEQIEYLKFLQLSWLPVLPQTTRKHFSSVSFMVFEVTGQTSKTLEKPLEEVPMYLAYFALRFMVLQLIVKLCIFTVLCKIE